MQRSISHPLSSTVLESHPSHCVHMHHIVCTLHCPCQEHGIVCGACVSPTGETLRENNLGILVPRKNMCPRKWNLLWARKVLEIFKYSDYFSDTEYAGNHLYILIIFHFRISVEWFKYSWDFTPIFCIWVFFIIHSGWCHGSAVRSRLPTSTICSIIII